MAIQKLPPSISQNCLKEIKVIPRNPCRPYDTGNGRMWRSGHGSARQIPLDPITPQIAGGTRASFIAHQEILLVRQTTHKPVRTARIPPLFHGGDPCFSPITWSFASRRHSGRDRHRRFQWRWFRRPGRRRHGRQRCSGLLRRGQRLIHRRPGAAGYCSPPVSIVTGDFNGDGRLDIAVGSTPPACSTAESPLHAVFLNTGNDTFGLGPETHHRRPGRQPPTSPSPWPRPISTAMPKPTSPPPTPSMAMSSSSSALPPGDSRPPSPMPSALTPPPSPPSISTVMATPTSPSPAWAWIPTWLAHRPG